MKPSEMKALLDNEGMVFDELLMLEMVRNLEDEKTKRAGVEDFDSVGVRVMEIVATANLFNVSSPATTYKYLHNLNSKNYIRKEIDGGDRRACVISVTGLGRELLEKLGA